MNIFKTQNKVIADIFNSIIFPVCAGIYFIIWTFYLFKYQEEVVPAIVPVFFLVYTTLGSMFGGIFLAFAVASIIFAIAISSNKYILLAEILWLILIFLFVERHRIRYFLAEQKHTIEHEVLDRDISILKYSISLSEKKTLSAIQKMERFKSFIQIISSLESSIVEKELISKIEDLASKIISKGTWEIKRFAKKNNFVNYVKEHKTPLLVSDIKTDSRFANANYKNITSVIAMPIKINNSVWGVIIGTSDSKTIRFDDSDLRLLSVLADMITIVLYNSSLYNKLEELAITDSLTGLYTRTYFMERLKEEMQRSQTNNIPLVISIIDIDFFKKVNDTYGHQAGDSLIKQISEILNKRFREIDLLTRYGGEEFAVLMTHIEEHEAYKILEELRINIENREFVLTQKNSEQVKINKTISIGLVQLSDEKTIEQIVSKADSALYEAKKTGRNKTCVFNAKGSNV